MVVVALFFLKNKGIYQAQNQQSNGLSYKEIALKDLVNKDTDGDGIVDWEEGLYGLDPTKKETTAGIPDVTAINKLKITQGDNVEKTNDKNGDNIENLSKTDQFSRELFAAVAAVSQNGVVDEATIEQMAASLSEKIQNPVVRKIYLTSDIKAINDNGIQAFINYNNALDSIYAKYPIMDYTILEVLQKFIADGNDVDVEALKKLDPIIEQTNKVIEKMAKTSVPQTISIFHLNVINSQERLVENLNDIRLFENDPMIALSGISKYEENAAQLTADINNLANAITEKFNQQP